MSVVDSYYEELERKDKSDLVFTSELQKMPDCAELEKGSSMDMITEREAEIGKLAEIDIRLALFKKSIGRIKQPGSFHKADQVSIVLDDAANLLTDLIYFIHHFAIKASELEQKMMEVELKKLARESSRKSEQLEGDRRKPRLLLGENT